MNIAEILKDCPKGTKLYSPLFGECELIHIDCAKSPYPIVIEAGGEHHYFTKDGLFYREHINGECMLFPSKDNRDWSTFKVHKKEYAFKPFDKVLVRGQSAWIVDFYSHFNNGSDDFTRGHVTIGGIFENCIPYEGNQELVGTCDEPKYK